MTVRVAIVRTRDDVLAELIEREVNASPALRLVAAELVDPVEAEERLTEIARDTDVLIAIGEYQPRHLESIVEHHSGSVVSGILIGSDTVSMRLKQVGALQLIETLIALSSDRNRERSRLMKYQFIAGDDHSRGSYQFVEIESSDGPIFAAARDWVREALLDYWSRRPKSETDVLGRARGNETLAALLEPGQPIKPNAGEAEVFSALLELLNKESDAPLAHVFRRLDLNEIDLKLLLLALVPELDVDFQTAFGLLNDDLGRRYPTLALACAILGEPIKARGEIDRSGNLLRWRLLDGGAAFLRSDEMLRLSPALNSWLMGARTALLDEPTVRPFLRLKTYAGAMLLDTADDLSVALSLAAFFTSEDPRWMVMPAAHADRWRARCELAAVEAATPLLRCQLAAVLTMPRAEQREIVLHLVRAARLLGMLPVVDFGDLPADDSTLNLLEYFADAVALAPQCAVLVGSDVDRYLAALASRAVVTPDKSSFRETDLSAIYATAAMQSDFALSNAECERLAMAFPLSLKTIEDAVDLVALGGDDKELSPYERLVKACGHAASPNLSRLAHRITPSFRLDQVVLPPDSQAQLREIVGNVINAPTVLKRWGFGEQLPYGRGVAVLFSGPSGTGKTMASHAIAHELSAELFEVDVSRLVSKYVGETEKNLDMIFTEAEQANAVVALQEVDSIAGRRGLQKDAHDRYANMEVAYLLQRIENFTGLAILTTNFKQNMDPAFLRRLRFSIEFPKPDAKAREAIWHQCIPASAPVADDVDFSFLARHVELTGGNIRQVTLRAAFAAANAHSTIEMRHILAATRAELIKLGEHGAVRELGEIETFRTGELAA